MWESMNSMKLLHPVRVLEQACRQPARKPDKIHKPASEQEKQKRRCFHRQRRFFAVHSVFPPAVEHFPKMNINLTQAC
jgi:hypothetical protein